MRLVSAAIKDLQVSSITSILYVAFVSLTVLVFRVGVFLIEQRVANPGVSAVAQLVFSLYLAVVLSAIQAIVFASLGALIDRPVWKCAGSWEALRRFFLIWLILNLFIITLLSMRSRLIEAGWRDAVGLVELLALLAHLSAMPLGAAVMHWGALEWTELKDALYPLARLFQLTLIPVALAFVQYALIIMRNVLIDMDSMYAIFLLMVTDIPLIMCDLLLFALVWRICMISRDTPREEEDPFTF